MARCFDSATSILTASELSSEKRQQVIYNEIRRNVQQLNTGNPVKQNGQKYNRNTQINTTCDISSGYVEVAASYEVLTDVQDGAALCYPAPVITSTPAPSCSNLCANTFEAGFQDTSGENSEAALVFDASANAALQKLETNANKDSFVATLTPGFYAAASAGASFDLGLGADRYRNATFLGSCDTTTYTNPLFVIQYSTNGTNWFSDGIEPDFFSLNATTLQFCFQRSNVPTRYVRPYFVTNVSFNQIQIILTKN
jgi:hypothetical protein